MAAPTPSRTFLASQVRWAMGRGLPAQAAEDVVFEAWEKAAGSFDPQRGSFEAYMQRVVRNDCAYWWRRQGRTERAHTALRALPQGVADLAAERAARHQQALIDALDPEERRIFSAWALQKHLGKGRVTSSEVAGSLGMEPTAFTNAKRRLGARLEKLLAQLGLTPTQLIHGEDDVEHTG